MYCQWLSFDACFWGQVWQICDKFLYTPTTPTGYPSSMLFWEWHNLQKKLGLQFLQEDADFVWRVSECEELVVVNCKMLKLLKFTEYQGW